MAFHLFRFTLGFFPEFSSYKFCTFLVKFIHILSSLLLLEGDFIYHYILELAIICVFKGY